MAMTKKGEHPIYSIGINFEVDNTMPPPRNVIHEALEAVRGIDVEAPTSEVAEHYVDVLMRALMQVADAG
ncbi:MAG TPA: hypothetical protein VEO92_00155 [Candidatus Nitrosocosmicus sp.]|nr:hypothetical protein [Candidatus Nitrosocosmicus sp.]